MLVEWKAVYRGSEVERFESLPSWVTENLKSGGIESQLEKMQKLVAMMATEWLSSREHRIGDAVEALGVDGYGHKITRD